MVIPVPEPRKFNDSDLMDHAIRMVIPMKREFGVALNVQHFLHDFAYAKEVLDVALGSQDTRLRDNAAYIGTKIFGPRNSGAKPLVNTRLDTAAPAPVKPDTNATAELTEDELRARMMSKYKTGLR